MKVGLYDIPPNELPNFKLGWCPSCLAWVPDVYDIGSCPDCWCHLMSRETDAQGNLIGDVPDGR